MVVVIFHVMVKADGSPEQNGRTLIQAAMILIVAIGVVSASFPASEPVPNAEGSALLSTRSEAPSPAHASSSGAQVVSAIAAARLLSPPPSHQSLSNRKSPVVPATARLAVARAVMRAELAFRYDLSAAKYGRAASLPTCIPPPNA
jgi:hypothetical protein